MYEGCHNSNRLPSSLPPPADSDYNEAGKPKPQIVSPLVMCGPRGLRFDKPVTLTMPRFHGNQEALNGDMAPWKLNVMHASTQSDGATSASDVENGHYSLRRWHRTRQAAPELAACNRGMESDTSSGAGVTCDIAESVISILIDHF